MSDAELKSDLALADLIRDLAHAQEARRKKFAAIVRFVRHREASGTATNMMEQIHRDKQLCKTLVDYEAKSEIIGMMGVRAQIKNEAALPLGTPREGTESNR